MMFVFSLLNVVADFLPFDHKTYRYIILTCLTKKHVLTDEVEIKMTTCSA